MIIHIGVLKLSRRLMMFTPIPALVAAAAYFATLSRNVYPGISANLAATAAGLLPPSDAKHPLFAFVTRAAASTDIFSLPLRLNLFSALCGILCATLIYHIVARTILFAACEDAGGGEVDLAPADDEQNQPMLPELPQEITEYNNRIFRIAVTGGLIAAFVLIFTVPGWIASTRLDRSMFHLALCLASISLFPFCYCPGHLTRLFLASFLFTAGLFESAVFIFLLPFFFYFLLRLFFQINRRTLTAIVLICSVLAASALSLYCYQRNLSAPAPLAIPALLKSYAYALPFHHFHQMVSFFPRTGWIQLLLQTALPLSIIVFGSQTLFKEKRAASVSAICLLVLSVIPSLTNLSFAPFFLLQNALPAFSYAVIAAATAYAFAAISVILKKDAMLEDNTDHSLLDEERESSLKCMRIIAGISLLPLFTFLLIAPWRTYNHVNPKHGAFADEVSCMILDSMKARTVLITNGILDEHLIIQAHIRGKELTLIPLDPNPDTKLFTHLNRMIDNSPTFKELNKTRLKNALSIGTIQLAMEWIKMDRNVEDKAMIFATPELWVSSGYQAVPEGIAFGGKKSDKKTEPDALFQQHKLFAERISPILKERHSEQPQTAHIRSVLRTKAGFAANELGVLLEDMNKEEEAYSTYERASLIDPDNVSAAVNQYNLNRQHGFQPQMLDAMQKRAKTALKKAEQNNDSTLVILQKYGAIRQVGLYLQQTAAWSKRGVKAVSRAKMDKALSLSTQTGIEYLKENALVYLHSGNQKKAEECYLEVLQTTPSDPQALKGLCNIMIARADHINAEKWINTALNAGLEEDSLRYQQISAELLKGNKEHALELLYTATKEEPGDLRYWTMLADILLELGDTQLVEHRVLPSMQKALNNVDHCLVHAVKGQLLQSKGPVHYKGARLAYLDALSLNANLPEIWNKVFELDLILNNPAFKEADASNLLKLDPDHPLANYILGSSLLARNALPQSEDFLRRSIENRPTAMACNDLAENLRLQKKLEEAEVFARRARKLDPELLPAIDTLACILYDAERFDESIQLASKAVEARPGNLIYQLTLLRAQVSTGDKEGVLQRLKSIPDHDKNIPENLKKQIQAL